MKWKRWSIITSGFVSLMPLVVLSANLNNSVIVDGSKNEQLGANSGWFYQNHNERLLQAILQFSDNQFVNQPLLTTNLNFATWYRNYFLDLTISDLDPYGTKAAINLVYYDEHSGQKKAISAKLINLFPEIKWIQNEQLNVSNHLLGGLQNVNEFMENPVANLTKLIQFDQSVADLDQPDQNWLASTNLSAADLDKLKVSYHFGNPDPIKGQILNNEISFVVPTINRTDPIWDQNDHYERISYRFDLIDFIPVAPNYLFNLDQEVQLDPQGAVANLGVDNFNFNQFLNLMVNYQSNYLGQDQLIATNLDRTTFSKQISDFKIQVLNDNQMIVSLKLAGKHYQWKLDGFKEQLTIDYDKAIVVNANQYAWIEAWVEPFLNRDLGLLKILVGNNLGPIFWDLLNSKVDSTNINQVVKNYDVQILQTVGILALTITLNPDAPVIINPSQNQAIKLYFQLDQNRAWIKDRGIDQLIDDQGYDKLGDFSHNFIDFIDDPNGQRDFNPLLVTNLTKAEWLAMTTIQIERDWENRLALVQLQLHWFDQPVQSWQWKIISNRQPIKAQFASMVDPNWSNQFAVDDFDQNLVLDLINFNQQTNDDYGLKIATSRTIFSQVLLEQLKITKHWNRVGVEIKFADAKANSQMQSYYFEIINLKPSLQLIALTSGLTLSALLIAALAYLAIKLSRQKLIKVKIKQAQQYLRGFEDEK